MRNFFRCDICQTVVEVKDWTDEAAAVKLVSYLASQNPLGSISTNNNFQRSEFIKDDVCHRCRKEIFTGFADVLKKAMAKS